MQMLLDVLYEVPHALASMVAGAFIVDIPKGPLNRICSRAVGRQVEQLKAGMGRQPFFDLPRMVNLGVVGHDREAREGRCWVGMVERLEQVQEEPRDFAIPDTVRDSPG